MCFNTCIHIFISPMNKIERTTNTTIARIQRNTKIISILFVKLPISVRLKSNHLRSTLDSNILSNDRDRNSRDYYSLSFHSFHFFSGGYIQFESLLFHSTSQPPSFVSISFAPVHFYQYLIKTLMENNLSALMQRCRYYKYNCVYESSSSSYLRSLYFPYWKWTFVKKKM